MNDNDDPRTLPNSDLDLNLMLTNSVWGQNEVNKNLRDSLNKYYLDIDKNGDQTISKRSLWNLLGFYTRDMRLGNLSEWNNELEVCRFHIDLANDLLNCNYAEPFLIALSRSATILETSQSKGGFLRIKMNTFRQESVNQSLEPPKKSLLGGKRDGGI